MSIVGPRSSEYMIHRAQPTARRMFEIGSGSGSRPNTIWRPKPIPSNTNDVSVLNTVWPETPFYTTKPATNTKFVKSTYKARTLKDKGPEEPQLSRHDQHKQKIDTPDKTSDTSEYINKTGVFDEDQKKQLSKTQVSQGLAQPVTQTSIAHRSDEQHALERRAQNLVRELKIHA